MGIRDRKWFGKSKKENVEVSEGREDPSSLWSKSMVPNQHQPQPQSQPQPQQVTPTVVVNHHRLIQLRKFWLIFMFLTGVFFSFVMAVYLPNVWNQFYFLMQTLLP